MNKICQDCDKFDLFGEDCYCYYEGKKGCSQRIVKGTERPIYEEEN